MITDQINPQVKLGSRSPYGVLDMVGSVWEYCADFYDDRYYQTAPERDPKGPVSGRLCVSRGGSWLEANTWTRTALRQGIEPSWRDTRHGFRCAMDAGKYERRHAQARGTPADGVEDDERHSQACGARGRSGARLRDSRS